VPILWWVVPLRCQGVLRGCMNQLIVLPPLDASFVAWLVTQPLIERNIREDLQIIWQSWRGRSPTEFVGGRDAAQRVRSVADRAGFVETTSFYY
jgi:hypothetical protein